jgi:hypothetical protein
VTDDRDRRNTWFRVFEDDTVYSSRGSKSYLARELCDAAPGVSFTLRREDAKRLMMNYLSVHVTEHDFSFT